LVEKAYPYCCQQLNTRNMGRITLFTSDDLNSIAIKKALDTRKLPYVEISLDQNPKKTAELYALTGTLSLPKLFFNTRNAVASNDGGIDGILQVLRLSWDFSRKYKSPFAQFRAEIEPMLNPSKELFMLPVDCTGLENLSFEQYEDKVKPSKIMLFDTVNQLLYRDVVETL
jgi:glutaredoxin